jgi:hypothetical protein
LGFENISLKLQSDVVIMGEIGLAAQHKFE